MAGVYKWWPPMLQYIAMYHEHGLIQSMTEQQRIAFSVLNVLYGVCVEYEAGFINQFKS